MPRSGPDRQDDGSLAERVAAAILAGGHPLLLAHDPDRVLHPQPVAARLADAGLRVVAPNDAVELRVFVERARPWSRERPLVVATAEHLDDIAFDIWVRAHHVDLALHRFLPHLDYPALSGLPWPIVERIWAAAAPPGNLGPGSTDEFILIHGFGADAVYLSEPARLVTWLADYHAEAIAMPGRMAATLVRLLGDSERLSGWNLPDLISQQAVFERFVGNGWRSFVAYQGSELRESRPNYLVGFDSDQSLQDAVAGLVRRGAIRPVAIDDIGTLPSWALPGVSPADVAALAERRRLLVGIVAEAVKGFGDDSRWDAVQTLAQD